MRNAFADEITKLAAADERVVLLSGDIGNRLFNPYLESTPDRFFNCGVAEANMTSMAAGMALCGLRPFTYTITTFNTLRCIEQIRLDVCYQNLPVVIVGVGAGLSYSALNASHHALEDIGYLRMLPNMTVICPCDANETRSALRAAIAHDGPVYIRLGKKGEPVVYEDVPDFQIGRSAILRDGRDLCLIATGTILPNALDAAALLEQKGISVRVLNMHTVKPLDQDALVDAFSNFALVATVEEHSAAGGFGGAVAEWCSSRPGPIARLLRLGTGDCFMYEGGEQDYARSRFGLAPEQIAGSLETTLTEG